MATQTPQRPLPGAFFNTPAPSRPNLAAQRPPSFRLPSGSQPRPSTTVATSNPPNTQALDPEQQAASRITYKLSQELKFPALEEYIAQGISFDYDIPVAPAWSPFEKSKSFEIPEKILEQLNQAHMSTKLGLFSELHHAWATVDNVLYIWDYTHPNPELVGCDELSHTILEVKLAKPKPGVFKGEITHVLLIATVSEVAILALSATRSPEGIVSVGLYQTDLRIPLKGLQANRLVASSKTGRVFFGCKNSIDVFEITYQKEEKWFANKCGRINHTAKDVASVFVDFAYSITSGAPVPEYIRQIEVDDTRDLVYVLSSKSTIRVFHMKAPNQLNLLITRELKDIMGVIVHMVPPQSERLFPQDQQIVSISPIPRTESTKLALLATTKTGVRLYLSVTSVNYYYSDGNVPSSMQVQHIKFPPQTWQVDGQSGPSQNTTNGALDTQSMMGLNPTALSTRFSPGFNFSFINRDEQNQTLFISAPDSGRLGRTPEAGSASKFFESGQFIPLGAVAEDIGRVSPPFAASNAPAGFGNEMAVQFDQPVTEIAVLTNTGIHIFRRRRLVDTFAAALRTCKTEEDFEGVIKKFVRVYGRAETCVCAFAVACGQGLDASSDARMTNQLTDREVIEYARRTVTEHGGKPDPGESLDITQPSLDNVRPSPRAQALIIYTSRLVRSVWSGKILTESKTPAGGLALSSSVPLKKLQTVSLALLELQKFLKANRSFIPGLSGPEEIVRITSVSERTALQGEHQVLITQLKAISNITEGIAFLSQLFEQPVEEISLSLPDSYRQTFRDLTYQGLFTGSDGKPLAKELVKAIVNRSIAAGSNVDTVADALQRRCGSFCSTDDVLIFKAQEKLQKAIESGAETATGRTLLNESLNLFEKVAGSLSPDYLQAAVEQYLNMAFYAGKYHVR
jgi:nuclear pore complex protein Nup155